jgi:multicomponent Na+:H+ antiporter subunit E
MSTRTQLIKRSLTLLSLLAIAWLLWSGLFKPHLLGLGVFSCLLTLYVSHRMGYLKTELFALRFSRRLLRYWLWLAKEIVKSSIDVARVVIDPRLPISPQVVKIKASSVHPVDLTILANSITLTPGTLALDVHNGEITVHTLTKAGAEDLVMGEMDRRVAALRDH